MRKLIAAKIKDGFAAKAEVKCHVYDGFFINHRDTFIKLCYAEIQWIESYGDYSIIHIEKHQYCIHKGIGQVELWLDSVNDSLGTMFYRISRINILNLKMINKIIGNTLYMGEKNFTIGPSFREEALKCFDVL